MEEDEVEEPQTNQENEESYSLKRPKTERDPDYTEEESPEKAPQGAGKDEHYYKLFYWGKSCSRY